jgi:predicted DNA binding CopG/RHH family protein
VSRPNLSVTRPVAVTAAKVAAGEARIVVDCSESLHRKVKIRAIERGVSVKTYMLQLLQADGLTD